MYGAGNHFLSDDSPQSAENVPPEIRQRILGRKDCGNLSGLPVSVSFCAICLCAWDYCNDNIWHFRAPISGGFDVEPVLAAGDCYGSGVREGAKERHSTDRIAGFIFPAAYQLWRGNMFRVSQPVKKREREEIAMSDTASEYTKEELEGLHRISLQMAKVFVEFCKENDLTCYFCGGGCIGAVIKDLFRGTMILIFSCHAKIMKCL